MPAEGKILTERQKAFARRYIEIGNAAQAYRDAFGSTGNDRTCAVQGHRLLKLPLVSEYVAELRAEVKTNHAVTVDTILAELDEARELAKKTGNANALRQCSMDKAKLAGLLDKESDKPVDDMAGVLRDLIAKLPA